MPDIYDVVGICEPNDGERALAMQRPVYAGLRWLTLDEVLSDHSLDAVIVETGEQEQAKTALPFVRAGFAVHMDKPGSENEADFRALMDAVEAGGTVFQSGYMYRTNPAIVKAMELAKSGVLGDLICVEAHMSPYKYSPGYSDGVNTYLRGGMTTYLGCHLIDLVYSFMGEPIEVLPMNMCTGLGGTKGLDYGFVCYRYPHGISFIKTSALEVGGHLRRQLIVSGTKGTIEIEPIECPVTAEGITNANTVSMKLTLEGKPAEQFSYPPYGRYDGMMREFAALVRGQKKNPYTPDYEKKLFHLIMQSAGLIPAK